ncbi:MAG: hypothetical protein CVU65_17735 [Deltaproteobacteria bacterium HGW-Deltaproteobacteria-22]|nr:MAG: hypothetical protein CVU65_17735 [Deltaproteobacteria bacterium HGW-Deltaproteobacteria-22]
MKTQVFEKLAFTLCFVLAVSCDDKVTVKDSCGDAFVDPGEQCDGPELAGASCASLGYYETAGTLSCSPNCEFDATACGHRCGDGSVEADEGEQCDGTNVNGATCQSLGYGSGALTCDAACQWVTEACDTLCGNGYHETGEGCDDHNLDANDGCDADCAVESGWTCDEQTSPSECSPVCGDDLVLGQEICDGTDLRDQTCSDFGYHGGALACTISCDWDFTDCEAVGRCGDGIAQTAYETCDGTDLAGGTCEQEGFFLGGTLACDTACEAVTTGCTQFVQISTGSGHTCALRSDGAVWCWGRNSAGQLGDGTLIDRATPAPVTGLPPARRIGTGSFHSCALLNDGTVRCWGDNTFGRLGDGSGLNSPLPVAVADLTDVIELSVGGSHTCVVRSDGTAWCWGRNSFGQLGINDSTMPVTTPEQVDTLANVAGIACGSSHTCAWLTGGTAACWGSNFNGQVGDGTDLDQFFPVMLPTLTNVAMITAGGSHTCALLLDGSMLCWGTNNSGQFGDGTTVSSDTPVPGPSFNGVVSLDAGSQHTCIALSNGEARCWGINEYGQLGNDQHAGYRETPVVPIGLVQVLTLACGDDHTCAVVHAGAALQCWGFNSHGQLGDGSIIDRDTPVDVVFP